MGQALHRAAAARGAGRRAAALVLTFAACAATLAQPVQAQAARRFDAARFTVVAFSGDEPLARTLLDAAVARDTFPGLPRPRERVLISIAPDRRTFREWLGPSAPEWGAAFAFPSERRVIMQGRGASSDAGDPVRVVRHELAHLALHEYLGDLAPRWFDEGYASWSAGEWDRDQVIATNVALAMRGMPSLTALDSGFISGAQRADASYALAYRAVAELAQIDRTHGLALFFGYWKETGEFEKALRLAFGMTQSTFEQLWRDRTRRRYGVLALFTDLSIAAALMMFLVGPLWVIRRRRDKARMHALLLADRELERRERESALEQLLRSVDASSPDDPTPKETSA